ncbi:hypothetical protein [Burkholderia cepacia]|uniref:hypothetical protein n=1 Tax=Burkholderia cepacia TaxID=292 RepID=UPI0013F41EBE|nr:hypothetical protein [Burkholderia cepacia]NHB09818.1 hypothetical protein [Burkholderia cepacia]UQO37194.1 hypothetical protein L0Z22_31670 [Burkholderia cepacia]UQO51521.1 hypothetical protein L0Z05_37800 [Burkholderia cepacia]UQP05678.1 hypothetical protein L0Z01_14605 [Burkholderia cepacia]
MSRWRGREIVAAIRIRTVDARRRGSVNGTISTRYSQDALPERLIRRTFDRRNVEKRFAVVVSGASRKLATRGNVTIDVRLAQEGTAGGHVSIAISDTGVGIPEDATRARNTRRRTAARTH